MKNFFSPMSNAWTAVITHKLRSFLTILGVVIGIAAVIILMSIGNGVQASILNNFSNLGANIITVSPGSSTAGGVRGGFGSASTLTLEDAQAIADGVTNISGVSPTSNSGMQVVVGNQNMRVQVTGITPGYFNVNRSVMIQEGDYITQDDYDRYSKVALIGSNISATLFQGDDPVGKTIRMGTNIFTIKGLLQSEGQSFTSSDNMILIPLSTLQGIAGSITTSGLHIINSISLQATDKDSISSVEQQITLLLADRHKIAVGAANDFTLTSTDQLTASITSATQTLTLLLGAIAGISLLVGGIGVMNIMLVSVMERRREIGIRKALGAKERDIWGQFLLDSALLTFAGGIIGVAIGWGVSVLISNSGIITTVVTSGVVILAVAVSVGIGLFFGFYPAWQGSKLDPIQALRSE
jgi:putative ABC transport system permease protein